MKGESDNKLILILLLAIIFSCNEPKTTKEFFPNGSVKVEYSMIDGKREGLARFYYPDGKLWVTANYINDIQEGVAKEFYPNGHLKKIVNVRNGIAEDTQKIFYENGNIHEICYLIDREKYGQYEAFYDNGNLFRKGNVIRGYPDSTWITLDSITGRIKDVSVYKSGNKIRQLDSSELELKKLDNNSLPFTISIPQNWLVRYGYKGLLLLLASPKFDPVDSTVTNITISYGNVLKSGELLQDYVNQNINGLITDKELIKLISRKKLRIDGKQAEELIVYGNFQTKENNTTMCTSILSGDKIFDVVCVTPQRKISLYSELFKEIINSISFK